MSNPLIFTIDFGTQSVRAGLFNNEGNIVGIAKKQYDEPYFSKKMGYAEQDPNIYFDYLKEAVSKLISEHKDDLIDVVGVTLTCFRDSAVLLDKDYKVVRPMILWLDQRLADCKKTLPLFSRCLFRLVGMTDTIILNRKRSMANWIQENEPENWAKVEHYVPISTYMNYLLTGELKDSSSNCAGHYPIDFKKREWYKTDTHLKGQIFGVPHKLLPEIIPEGKVIGYITKEVEEKIGIPAGLPLFASGSDKSCETLGVGALDKKVASISYGTASSIEVTDRKYKDSEPFLPSLPSCVPNLYNMEVQVYRGYWMLNWFLNEFGGARVEQGIEQSLLLDELNKKLLEIPAGSDGLVLQPYWGPGLRRPLAKGAIVGFSDIHTKEHLYKSIIEGIAYALREGLEGFEKSNKQKVERIMVSGGGSKSDAICQITADIFGVPVSRVQTYETSSLGAAICGFLAAGVYNDPKEAVSKMVRTSKTFEPNMSVHEEYDYLFYKAYLKMFPNLKGLYKKVKQYADREKKFGKLD